MKGVTFFYRFSDGRFHIKMFLLSWCFVYITLSIFCKWMCVCVCVVYIYVFSYVLTYNCEYIYVMHVDTPEVDIGCILYVFFLLYWVWLPPLNTSSLIWQEALASLLWVSLVIVRPTRSWFGETHHSNTTFKCRLGIKISFPSQPSTHLHSF